jgi:hypothetical protein
MVEREKGKVICREHNEIVSMKVEYYKRYQAVDAEYTTVMFEFVPMGGKTSTFGGGWEAYYIEDKKSKEDTLVGNCDGCWKGKLTNFTNGTKTPHPFEAEINDPNLSILSGCWHIICNECVMGVEKALLVKYCCSGCPYCGHPTSFPKDLQI